MKRVPVGLVIVYLLCGALALIGCEAYHRVFEGGIDGDTIDTVALKANPWWVLRYAFKPLTTVLLYFILGPPPFDRFQKPIALGIFFSLIGDLALLWTPRAAFAIGLLGFLAAHICYIVAFRRVGRRTPRPAAVAVMLAATAALIYLNWPHLEGIALRIAVPVYALALATMVTSAWSTDRARLHWATPAAIGAFLFYIGDSSLALSSFYFQDQHGIPHSWLLTIGVYWSGQLGITLAARAGAVSAS
jgi:uncharacterized membrane protein YhhN